MCVCLCYVVLCSRGDADSAVCTQWSGVWEGQCWLPFYLLFYFRWREENEVLNIHVRLGGLEVVTNIFYSWYSLSKEFSLPPIQTYWIMDKAQRFRRVSSDDRKVHAAIQILFFLSTMYLRGSSFLFLCLLFFNQRESCKRYLSQKSKKKFLEQTLIAASVQRHDVIFPVTRDMQGMCDIKQATESMHLFL